jgi:hypothetical protein
MKRLLFVGALVLAGCGYDGHYRYECQDPENWEAEECNPPVCLVDGMCTENLLGFDPKLPATTTVPNPVEEDVTITEETVAP